MRCPHCSTMFHIGAETAANFSSDFIDNQIRVCYIGKDPDGEYWLHRVQCPGCRKLILTLVSSATSWQKDDYPAHYHGPAPNDKVNSVLVRPRVSGRGPVPSEVPQAIAEDYTKACLVINDSPEASAALSRRCLQHILNEAAGVRNTDNLNRTIQEVLKTGNLPSHMADDLDHVRIIGNFAAHPNKGENTGEIVSVEQGEAEWCLNVIESLFDFYFVMPAKSRSMRAAFDEKFGNA